MGAGFFVNTSTAKITRSTISENVALYGGGIEHDFFGDLLITDSTINGNIAEWRGGISNSGNAAIFNCTISGNTATDGRGGGIHTNFGYVRISQSTITSNTSLSSSGGGIYAIGLAYHNSSTTVEGCIIAGNFGNDVDLSDSGPFSTFSSGGHNLVGMGNGVAEFDSPGDQTGVLNPQLGPLADNGGSTMTHALLPDSPAINAGNPNFDPADFDPPLIYDQRSTGYNRVVGGRVDIGAYEVQTSSPSGDFDVDGDVDGRDFLMWQRGGSPNPLSSGDLGLWQEQYGEGEELSAISSPLLASQENSEQGATADSSSSAYDDSKNSIVFDDLHPLLTARQADSDTQMFFADEYAGEVDRAFEQFSTIPQIRAAGFGEMVARRVTKISCFQLDNFHSMSD